MGLTDCGFRVTVDHDAFNAFLSESERSMNAAIVELDSLADTIGTAAQDHHLLTI